MPLVTHQDNDAYARSMGFPDAATMIAWNQRRMERTAPPNNAFNMPMDQNLLQQALAIHPAFLFRNILDRMQSAIGGNK